MLLALIPYITLEDDAAEVWIIDVMEPPTTPEAVVAILAQFADEDPADHDAIAAHCDLWRADRILIPESAERWRAVSITAALAGRLVEIR